MQITYSIEYIQDDSEMIRFVSDLIKEHEIGAKVGYEDGEILISVDDSEEKIENFFQELALKMPLSIFLGDSKLKEQFVENPANLSIKKDINFSLTQDFLLKILDKNSKDYLNPFADISHFGYSYEKAENASYSLYVDKKIQNISNEEIFENLIKALKSGESIKVDTFFGTKIFSLYNIEKTLLPDVLLSNTKDISTLFEIAKKEFLAIGSIQRVKTYARINSDFDVEKRFVGNAAKVSLPFCAIEFILAHFLNLSNIYYVFQKEDDNLDSRYHLCIEGVKLLSQKIATVIGMDNDLYITEGSRGVCEIKNLDLIEEDSAYIGAIKSVIFENALEEQKLATLYLSKNNRSRFCAYSKERGVVPFIDFPILQSNVESILENISKVSGAEKLVENFKKSIDIKPISSVKNVENLEELFGLFALFCGFDSIDLKSGYQDLKASTVGYEEQGGVKIDMKIEKNSTTYLFNPYKTIQSIMSFRIAGVSKEMLSYSIFESFADFVNDNLYEICKQNDTKSAIISGSFFENKVLTKRLKKHSTNIYQIYKNRALPMDGENIIYGLSLD